MDERVLSCMDLDKEPGKPKCCDVCHDDMDDGYMEPLEHYDGDKLTHRVCCVVSIWLDERAADSAGERHDK